MSELDLIDGYSAYTSPQELDLHDGQLANPAFSPAASPLVPILLRATVIAARSSQQCAIAAAGGISNIGRTIREVC